MDTLTRTGIAVPSENRLDPVAAVAAYRSIALAFETLGALFSQGTLANRPTAGTAGRFYKVLGDTVSRIYYDDGTQWVAVGGDTPPVDPAADVPGLRTLGTGALQASPGNHGHATSSVVGLDAALTALQAALDDFKITVVMGAI